MNKCPGCGALTEHELCERCFRIRHYNEYKQVEIKENEFLEKLDEIKNELTLVVIDIMDIPENFDIFKKIKNKILVLTKRDLLPKSINDFKIIDYLRNENFKNIVITSSNKNYNFDLLMDVIKKHQTSKNVYVVGYTNSGKSTLLNKIIYNYAEEKRELTTSMLPSTTLDKIEIEINENLTLIDTPGIIDSGSVSFSLDKTILKKLVLKKPIRPITYQIKDKQYIEIEDFFKIEFSKNNSATFYVSNNLKIDRVFDKIVEETKEIKVQNSDIVIKGLGFINIKKRDTVKVYTKEKIEVFCRESIIKD